MAESTPSLPADAPIASLSLAERFPACFNFTTPQPLKIGIRDDLLALPDGFERPAVKRFLTRYCNRPRYRRCLKAGAVRVDLQGQPAGLVTVEEAEAARTAVAAWKAHKAGLPPPPNTVAPHNAPTTTTRLPNDTPLPQENLVPGRLELTVKFSELPQPLAVQGGMKLGIQTGEGIVTAILPAKVWKKLAQAATDYPQWVAALSGALDQIKEGELVLKHPTLQIFEKKSKPSQEPATATAEALASPAVTSNTSSTSASAPAPVTATTESSVHTVTTPTVPAESTSPPTVVRATLSLKGKGQKAG